MELVSRLFDDRGPENRVRVGVPELDDAAIISDGPEFDLVIASDFVRGPQFNLFKAGFLDWRDIGYFLVVANLSDIAAMGAAPRGLTVVVRYPTASDSDLGIAQFSELLSGIREAASHYETPVVGGDLGGYSCPVLAATAFGAVPRGRGLLRSAAEPGERLCVAGPIGRALMAQYYFLHARGAGRVLPRNLERYLLNGWKRAEARIEEGLALTRNRACRCAQDTSDGFRQTLEQISNASGVGFRVFADALTLDPAVEAMFGVSHESYELAFSVSPDFALVFTLPSAAVEGATAEFHRNGLFFSVVGEVVAENELTLVMDGRERELPGRQWDHGKFTIVDDFAKESA